MSVRLEIKHKDYASLVYLTSKQALLEGIVLHTDTPLKDVEVEVDFSPVYIQPLYWEFTRVGAGEFRLPLQEEQADLPALAALREQEPGRCTVTLTATGQAPVVAESGFTWLPALCLPDGDDLPGALAAMVLPADPVVRRLVNIGADRLGERGLSRWQGYRAWDNLIYNQIHMLWHMLCAVQPVYDTAGTDGMRTVRTPSETLVGKRATELDIAAMFAALLAKVGFNPLIIRLPEHTLAGAWLRDDTLPAAVEHDPDVVQDLWEKGDLLLLEVTAGTGADGRPPDFETAKGCADGLLGGVLEAEGFTALDIIHLWSTGIRPVSEYLPDQTGTAPAIPAATEREDIYLPEQSGEEMEEEASLVTPRKRTRMENWQLRLLDLSLRNNLLNSRADRTQILLHIPDIAKLEDDLYDGKSFSLHCPNSGPACVVTAAGMGVKADPSTLEDLAQQAQKMYKRKQLLALRRKAADDNEQLQRRVYSLYLAAKHDMEESGGSTLNLACGFLKWHRTTGDDTPLYAPILLVPAKLTRPNARSGFSLQSGDEDTRINHTLLQLLGTEYGIHMPLLEGDLPTDQSGVDVALIMQTVRDAISPMPGWEVLDCCALGTYSFAKYLMWKDMADHTAQLLQNTIVRHLAAEEPQAFPTQVDFPDPKTLDSQADAKKVYTPLSADSSQLAAVLAAAQGKNFVLIGPPGTGKSQTIANMIAHCLGHGKTVLFVAEKAAALNVVYSRLKRIGLGDFCLELHSNKANKKSVLAQFKAVLEHVQGTVDDPAWDRTASGLQTLRDSLNVLPQKLHHPYPDGTSLYHDICTISDHRYTPDLTPCPYEVELCAAEQKEEMLEHARNLALRFTPVQKLLPGKADDIRATAYTSTWDADLADSLGRYGDVAQAQEDMYDTLAGHLGMDPAKVRGEEAELIQLLQAAIQTCGNDVRPLLPGTAAGTLKTLRKILKLIKEYGKLKTWLSLPYPENFQRDPQLAWWLREWKEAEDSNFIWRFFVHRRIRKTLQAKASCTKEPYCRRDLETLINMRGKADEIRRLSDSCHLPSCAHGMETTKADLDKAEKWVKLLQGINKLHHFAEKWLAGKRNNPMVPGKPAMQTLTDLLKAKKELTDVANHLAGLLGTKPPFVQEAGVDGIRQWAAGLLALRPHWRALTLWNGQAAASDSARYTPMVQALLNHSVDPDELEDTVLANFSKRRITQAVDHVPELNRFTAQERESRIAEFRQRDRDTLTAAERHILSVLTTNAARTVNKPYPQYRKQLAFLKHEIEKQRAHKAPRTLLANIPDLLPALKPCMLMSPLSVAQYLDAGAKPFDVVIFDEASQIPVWDAIGAISRGKSAVIVGDPRQMPPTSFFTRTKIQDAEEDDTDAPVQDLESILDECRACGIPEMRLTWHYRSKSESLIAFSNHHYYNGKLTTFPAPVTTDTALQYHHTHGTYQRGAGKRINPIEAQALVDHVLQTLRAPGFRYTEATSIGIVTFNAQQQKLIEDMLEEARTQDPALEPYFAEDNPEAVFVKNLENVQGDERGCIYFSTTYGPNGKGVVSMNFGPLNLTGGERRLNVAVTRARAAMHVFTSLRPEDIDLDRTGSLGAAHLKGFLKYAAGGRMDFRQNTGATGRKDGDLTGIIAAKLEGLGWKCHTGIGTSGFRLDIAVEHPEQPGTMLACIRTDGPGYATANTARDRDILTGDVLEGLGWRVFRLWALDWWITPQTCLSALDTALRSAAKEQPYTPQPLPSLLPQG